MAETVGVLNVEITGRLDQLDRALRTAETKVKSSGAKIEKSLGQALSFGKLASGLSIATQSATAAIDGLNFAFQGLSGNVEKAYAAQVKFEKSLGAIPVVGDAFNLGNAIGEAIFGDKADAAAINEQSKKADAAREAMAKAAAKAQEQIQQLDRSLALQSESNPGRRRELEAQFKRDDRETGIANLGGANEARIRELSKKLFDIESRADPEDEKIALRDLERKVALSGSSLDPLRRQRLEAGFEREDTIRDAMGLSPEVQAKIKGLADRQFQFASMPKLTHETLSASGVALNLPGMGQSDQPKAKQVDRTNIILESMLRKMDQLRGVGVAG